MENLRELLKERDIKGISEWADGNRRAMSTLVSFIFEEDPLIRWRAIEALGVVARERAITGLEEIRGIIRRLFWTMNDESGSVGWHAPEAIAEILFNTTHLIEEYADILTSYMTQSPFERGVHWAIARIAAARPRVFRYMVPRLELSLENPDPSIRGYTAIALALIDGNSGFHEKLEPLKADNTTLSLYDFRSGEIFETHVRQIAENASRERDRTGLFDAVSASLANNSY